jgi:5-hydroxyisourate hydrolase
MGVSTHVLDAVAGRPAVGVPVTLERRGTAGWDAVAAGETDSDGRIADLAPSTEAGDHRLTFAVDGYFDVDSFYPEVVIVFRIADPQAHHHVPLLLSPAAYTTYRGS